MAHVIPQLPRRSLLLGAGVTLCNLLHGQETTPTFTTELKVVNVLASVRTKQGQIVRDLGKDDFRLEEDGRPQTIRYFSRETDLPLLLGLLIDTSGSQRRVLMAEGLASDEFIQQVLRPDRDRAFISRFDREVKSLQSLTSSRDKLRAALTSLTMQEERLGTNPLPPQQRGWRRGGTALFDAVVIASDKVMRKRPGRKALIVLSDGVDSGSVFGEDAAVASAQQADTLVYSILFSDEQAYGRGGSWGGGRSGEGKDILKRMSRDTGGGFFEVSAKQPLPQVFQQIDEELRNQYSFGYVSDRPDTSRSGFRKIKLRTRQSGMVVQTRSGYYPTVGNGAS